MERIFEIAKRWSKLPYKDCPSIKEQKALTGFICNSCKRSCSYFDLESWCCDFDEGNEGMVCSECYEMEMGDDL